MFKTILLVANYSLLLTKVKHTLHLNTVRIEIFISPQKIPVTCFQSQSFNWPYILETGLYFQDGLISLDLLLIHVLSKHV